MSCSYGVIGSGWRAEYYLRIAKSLPEKFKVVGLATTNAERACYLKAKYGVDIYSSKEALVDSVKMDFCVVSIKRDFAPETIIFLNRRGIPVLAETPPAGGLEALNNLYNETKGEGIQVAEQYSMMPIHHAGLRLIESGIIGQPVLANISFSHGYHGVSLIRRYLGLGLNLPTVSGRQFKIPVLAGTNRQGPPEKEVIVEKLQTIATLDFGNAVGIFEFESDQHRSYVRTNKVQIKGTHGEIFNNQVKYLPSFNLPMSGNIMRRSMGEDLNLEGTGLYQLSFGNEILYKNPYPSSGLNDDELAVAACLERMNVYVYGGNTFYSLAEACHDAHLEYLINTACETKTELVGQPQAWNK